MEEIKIKKPKKIIILLAIIVLAIIPFYYKTFSAPWKTFISATGTVKTNTSPTSSLTGGLVGYWTLDGQDTNWETNTTTDRSGSSNTGTMINMSTSTNPISGVVGQGLSFDGSSDSVLTGDSASLSIAGAMSASFWMKASNVSTEQSIIEKYDAAVGQRSYRVVIKTAFCNNNEINFTLSSTGSPFTGAVYCSNPVLSANQWHHVVVTYIPSTSMKIYVNGTDQTRAFVAGSGIPASIFDSTRGLAIGAGFSNSATPNTTFFNGLIDETRIYNRALSASEITELYNMGANRLVKTNMPHNDRLTGGLVGYWTFNGPDTVWTSSTVGTVADKSSAGTNTGTMQGMFQSTSPVSGVVGQALKFNSSWVAVPYASTLAPTTAISYGAWFKTNDKTEDTRIISKTESGGYNINLNQANVVAFCTANTLCSVLRNSGTYYAVKYSTSNIINNSWYHVFITYDGETLIMYVNGVPVDTNTSPTGAIQYGFSNPFCIGRESGEALCTDGTYYFNGSLDEVRVYNRALSDTEVLELYQSVTGR